MGKNCFLEEVTFESLQNYLIKYAFKATYFLDLKDVFGMVSISKWHNSRSDYRIWKMSDNDGKVSHLQ